MSRLFFNLLITNNIPIVGIFEFIVKSYPRIIEACIFLIKVIKIYYLVKKQMLV